MIAMTDIKSIVENLVSTDDFDHKKLIEECKFVGKEKEVADAFWYPGFHQKYLEITEDIISKWLEPKFPGFVYTQFLSMLCKNYKEGRDYIIKKAEKGAKIYVLGKTWRTIIMNSGSSYAPAAQKVSKKIDDVSKMATLELKKGLMSKIGR